MLGKLLNSRKCFKLVCGAGNEDAVEVEKLVALYATAGAHYFDLSAREDVVLAAKAGLERVISREQIPQYCLNVSVGMKGDPHVSKAALNATLCINCGACRDACLQKAIMKGTQVHCVNTTRCIGCGACITACPTCAISTYSESTPLEEVLPPLVQLGLDSIELHAVSDDEPGVTDQWRSIEAKFDGMLSLCVDRSRLGDAQLLARIRSLIAGRKPFSTIIQADGAPMSGCDDRHETTLQAIATAQIVQRAKLPVFLMLSGGTNSKTSEMAKLFGVDAHGVALGSYARKIVRDQIVRDDFLTNPVLFQAALVTARDLVDKSLSYMG